MSMLAEGIKVVGASLDNGLLSVDLERPARAAAPRTVKINPGRHASGEDGVTVAVDNTARKAS